MRFCNGLEGIIIIGSIFTSHFPTAVNVLSTVFFNHTSISYIYINKYVYYIDGYYSVNRGIMIFRRLIPIDPHCRNENRFTRNYPIG